MEEGVRCARGFCAVYCFGFFKSRESAGLGAPGCIVQEIHRGKFPKDPFIFDSFCKDMENVIDLSAKQRKKALSTEKEGEGILKSVALHPVNDRLFRFYPSALF